MQVAFRDVLGLDAVHNSWDEDRKVQHRGKEGELTLLLTIASVQNNARPVVGFAVALLKVFGAMVQKEAKAKTNDDERDSALEPSSTFNLRINFKTHAHNKKHPRRSRAAPQMSSSENDSDIPEHVPLSDSKRQVIGRKKDVAKELAQAKLRRKEHNRERDHRLKEQALKQQAALIADSEPEEERSTEEDAEAKVPRLLPDHIFAAAFNQPPPVPGPPVLEDAPPKTQQGKRKRTDPAQRDRVIG